MSVKKPREFQPPKIHQVVAAIGRVTFLEIVRDKILYNSALFALLLLGVGYLAASLSFIRPERILTDFGLSAINLVGSFLGVLLGGIAVAREFERRTIYVALARPISRAQFVLGKYLGVCAVLALNWLLLVAVFLLILRLMSGPGAKWFSGTLMAGLFLQLIQSWVMAGVSLFFSILATTSLAVMFSIGIYLVGNNISQLRLLSAQSDAAGAKFVLDAVSALHPNLERFNLGSQVTYHLPLQGSVLLVSVLYGIVLMGFFVAASSLVVRRKDA